MHFVERRVRRLKFSPARTAVALRLTSSADGLAFEQTSDVSRSGDLVRDTIGLAKGEIRVVAAREERAFAQSASGTGGAALFRYFGSVDVRARMKLAASVKSGALC